MRRLPVPARYVLPIAAVGCGVLLWALRSTSTQSPTAEATVVEGPLSVRLVESGTLRAVSSTTYRSPLEGREAEVTFLAPEGLAVNAGDLIVRIDPAPVIAERDRTAQTLAQARLELRVVESDLEEARATVGALDEGDGSLEAEEAAAALQLAERRLARARRQAEELESLLAGGFVTSDEVEQASLDVEQQEAGVRLARRRLETLRSVTQPRGRQRAQLQAAQQTARHEHAIQRVRELEARVAALTEAVERCRIYAQAGGLIVYEENLTAMPRRKIRVGDRVTPSQGLVTIPEIDRMIVETSVREVDVHMVKVGLPVTVRLDAFPDRPLDGRVEAVGALARGSLDRPFEAKRFDVRVSLSPSSLPLRPDMTARAEILVADRDRVVLVPVTAVFERGATRVAHVITGSSVTTKELVLGASDGIHVEVRSGVAAGDRVLLQDTSGGAAR